MALDTLENKTAEEISNNLNNLNDEQKIQLQANFRRSAKGFEIITVFFRNLFRLDFRDTTVQDLENGVFYKKEDGNFVLDGTNNDLTYEKIKNAKQIVSSQKDEDIIQLTQTLLESGDELSETLKDPESGVRKLIDNHLTREDTSQDPKSMILTAFLQSNNIGRFIDNKHLFFEGNLDKRLSTMSLNDPSQENLLLHQLACAAHSEERINTIDKLIDNGVSLTELDEKGQSFIHGMFAEMKTGEGQNRDYTPAFKHFIEKYPKDVWPMLLQKDNEDFSPLDMMLQNDRAIRNYCPALDYIMKNKEHSGDQKSPIENRLNKVDDLQGKVKKAVEEYEKMLAKREKEMEEMRQKSQKNKKGDDKNIPENTLYIPKRTKQETNFTGKEEQKREDEERNKTPDKGPGF